MKWSEYYYREQLPQNVRNEVNEKFRELTMLNPSFKEEVFSIDGTELLRQNDDRVR